jgi:magnesium-transporting ATPase (P-type)
MGLVFGCYEDSLTRFRPKLKNYGAINKMREVILQTMAFFLTFWAAIFLLSGSLGLSPEDIARLSKPQRDTQTELARNLSNQKADTLTGAVLLFAAFIFQIILFFLPVTWQRILGGNKKALVYGIVLSMIILILSGWLDIYLRRSIYENVTKILS